MKKENTSLNYVKMEENILKFWQNEQIFNKLKAKNEKTGKYYATLDGPITANYNMGLHHAYNRTFKDAMFKFAALQGCDQHYQNGFDAHGLPVETRVERELGINSKKEIETYGIDNFVKACMDTVDKYSLSIANSSIRLGQWMNWDNSYYTNSDENIKAIWHFLQKCHEKNWIQLSHRPTPWCTRCGTSIGEHDMSGDDVYRNDTCQAIFFKCPIKGMDADILVWTTTPWTLCANVAVAVNPKMTYCEVQVKSSNRHIIVLENALKVLKDDAVKVVKTFKGSQLVGKVYETCFPELAQQNFEHKIVAWDQVDATEGSGSVHIAPGCGVEDYELGVSLGLKKIIPIDEAGIFYPDFGVLAGKNSNCDETRDFIFEVLKSRGKVYYTHKYTHRYPHCWRCKEPLVYRLIQQWVIKMDELRPTLIKAIDEVEFNPPYMKKRMLDWLNNMGDWSISRSRYYGLPLPFYKCDKCDHLTVVGSIDELKKLALNPQEVDKMPHIHRPYIDKVQIKCPHCGSAVERIKEVGDCWLDAGITPFSTKKYFTDKKFFDKNFPVECVCEGKEQIRLWFYSLLVMSVVLTGKAPYKRICTTPMLLDQEGKKLSKSSPNNIPLDTCFEEIGADIIRYNFVSTPLVNDVIFSRSTCDEIKRKLIGLWNAYIFLNTYAVLDKPDLTGFTPDKKQLTTTDKWLISRINEFAKNAQEYYSNQQFGAVTKDFEVLVDDLTNWYIRNNRRRFYKSESDADTKNAYYCLHYALKNICMVMFPIIPFITEYIWQNAVRELDRSAAESVALNGYKLNEYALNDTKLVAETNLVRNVFAIAGRLRNENQIKVKQPLRTLYVGGDPVAQSALASYESIIKDELNIKELKLLTDDSTFNDEYLSVNFKTAGAVLKGDVQKLKSALAALSPEENTNAVKGYKAGKVTVGEFANLDSSLFNLEKRPKQDYVIAHENGITVVLDVTLDERLIEEGLYREFVRGLQVLRKEAGFEIDERIHAQFTTTDTALENMLNAYLNKIKQEVLIKEVTTLKTVTIEKELDVGNSTIQVKLSK